MTDELCEDEGCPHFGTPHTCNPAKTDTTSYMSRHRPICSVLADIQTVAEAKGDLITLALVAEAISYAQRMSNRLMEHKRREVAAPGPADAVSEAEVEAALDARVEGGTTTMLQWMRAGIHHYEPAKKMMRAALEAAQRARK